ncbi:type I polyketide synthase [Actinokineospora sp. NBRC 105648]|uniref:type I polyketide synthase n=1 Tax=Actinokineospora sp. NBRC 105648 TaxID=3032206 RepID=UPI0024A4535A|nr:type I polyketide synthase [Actinokineospora sp. NBRC 105648]GLZ42765.1 polyketide synthase [Actinokineospora sp. NBRC 105648]
MSSRVAVVGTACHYPDAHDPDELWQAVLTGRQSFRRVPPGRLSPAYLGERDDPDRTYVTHAGVLRDWDFDRSRFRVPVGVHRAVDHTHWLALQTAAEALADAGTPDGDTLPRDEVGVILGNSLAGEFSRATQLRVRWPFIARAAATALRRGEVTAELSATVLAELEREVKGAFPAPTEETLAGALANTIAGRIANHFDLRGGGYTVDGACSSSLLAVVHGARAVASGELRFALVGGVDLSIDPLELVGFARVGVLGVDQMRVYDADPTGFLPGEGCGVILLTTVDEAERRGLRVLAELRGWGISADGAGGLTRPSASGQRRAMDHAYRMAGVDPAAVDLVEGHGTGTAVGDQAELEALSGLRGAGAPRAALGSIKANIGHTKAAAGIAGLLKAISAVRSGVLPPTTGCADPHPLLRDPLTPLRTLPAPEPWGRSTRLASVSALGFGGINSHLVVGSGPGAGPGGPLPQVTRARHDIVLLGADSAPALARLLTELADWFGALSTAEVHDVAATTHAKASAAEVRCALVAASPTELCAAATAAAARLADWDGALTVASKAGFVLATGSPPAVGLIFPGQAAPVRPDLPAWAEDLPIPPFPDEARPHADTVDTAAAQPAIVRQSLAGLAWLDRVGCVAVGAVGHSLGEITALTWSGALTPVDAMALATARGRLMAEHGAAGTTMASLDAPVGVLADLVQGTSVVVACDNGPRRTAIAGPTSQVEEVLARASAKGIAGTLLPVSHGFHSPAMRPVTAPLRTVLASLAFTTPQRPVLSTVTGKAVDSNLAETLLAQLTSPVRFREAVTALADRCGVLVEVGPGHTLSGLAADCAPDTPVVALDCGGPPRAHALATAALIACGAASAVPWFAGRSHRHLDPGTPMSFLTNPCETGAIEPVPVHAPSAPAPVVVTASDPVLALRTRLAAECELDLAGITESTSLSRDLHLSSLRVVTLITGVAGDLGRKPPTRFPEFADATVGEAAQALAELDVVDEHAGALVRGVDDWVRAFAHHWVPGVPNRPAVEVDWVVRAPQDHWLRRVFRAHPGGRAGLVVAVPDDAGTGDVAGLLREVAERRPTVLAIVHNGHPAAAAIARSAHVELVDCATTVVQVPAGTTNIDTGLITGSGYQELRMRPDGSVEHLETAACPPATPGDPPIGPGEVCVVTGGVTGITAHTAVALALRTGCTLLFIGRRPQTEPTVAEGLAAVQARVDAHYHRADITDRQAAVDTLAAARALGPVRGLLHGAAVNEPRTMSTVDSTSLHRALAPKVDGLRNLLQEAGSELRLAVAYGSIIGRTGLAGQSEYCVANEWLRHTMVEWASDHPECHAHCVEWSLWSEIGMGARMGVVDGLAAQGLTPITPDAGAEALLSLLGTSGAPVTVLISGRFPRIDTLSIALTDVPLLRFLEDVRTATPGVEVVADSTLTLGDDPYLAEHRVDGVSVLPAVLGLEAIAQATHALTGPRPAWSFRDLDLTSPVTGDTARVVRVATLLDGDNVRSALADDSDGFTHPRVTCTVVPASNPPPFDNPGPVPTARTDIHPYYGPLFFHTGRFTRLRDYVTLSAFEVAAWVDTASLDWFAPIHAQRLLLGDPGLLDASIHVLLACLPHRTVLPVGADAVTIWRRPTGPVLVRARELRHTTDDFIFDVNLTDTDGSAVARWSGLRLHAVGTREWRTTLPTPLIGPLLSRRLIECGVADHLEIRTDRPGRLRLDVQSDCRVWTSAAESGTEDRLSVMLRDKTGESQPESAARSTAIHEVLNAANTTTDPTIQLVDDGCVVLDVPDTIRIASLLTGTTAVAVGIPVR